MPRLFASFLIQVCLAHVCLGGSKQTIGKVASLTACDVEAKQVGDWQVKAIDAVGKKEASIPRATERQPGWFKASWIDPWGGRIGGLMTIHRAYPLVRFAVQRFDEAKFPRETASPYGQDGARLEALKKYVTSAFKKECAHQPDLPITCIVRFSILNAQTWMYATGLLGKKSHVLSLPCMHATARTLLQRLQEKREGPAEGPAAERLWSFVFKQAYDKGGIEQKQKILKLAAQVDPERMEETAWEVQVCRVTQYAGRIFSVPLLKNVLAGFCFFGAFVWAKIGLCRLINGCVVSTVNGLIQMRSAMITKGVIRTITVVDTLYRNRFRIWLGHCFVRQMIGSRVRGVKLVTFCVDTMLYFPFFAAWSIARKTAFLVYHAQTRVSDSLVDISNRTLKEKLDSGRRKAYAVWMKLFTEASTQGICLN